jgi:hypothetical protein
MSDRTKMLYQKKIGANHKKEIAKDAGEGAGSQTRIRLCEKSLSLMTIYR